MSNGPKNDCPKCGKPKPIRYDLCYACDQVEKHGEAAFTQGPNKAKWFDSGNRAYRYKWGQMNAPLCRSSANNQVERLAEEFPELAACRCLDCLEKFGEPNRVQHMENLKNAGFIWKDCGWIGCHNQGYYGRDLVKIMEQRGGIFYCQEHAEQQTKAKEIHGLVGGLVDKLRM